MATGYTVHFREDPTSPQWEDTFDKGTDYENKVNAEKRAYEVTINGGMAVVVPFEIKERE